jgi:hypothetical protein
MSKQQSASRAHLALVDRDDLRRILGKIDEAKVIEILSLIPTLAELEQAAIWATGDGDILAKAGRSLAGVAAEIFDILTADEEEPAPTR